MSQRLVLDVSELPSLVQGHRGGLWWGMVGLVVLELVVFAVLISSYFYLKFLNPHWPPAGEELPKLLLPSLNTLVLLASSAAIYYGDTSISERGSLRGLIVGMGTATLLALLFLTLKVVEYSQVEYFWDSHAYGSTVWTIIVFHSSHVASVVLKTAVVLALATKGYWSRERCQGVKINGLYWHFVVLIWIPLYITIYWSPRIP